jgi:hypothetical protein
MTISEKTWEYIRTHVDGDVRKLALQGVKDAEIDLPMALQQIAGRQTAGRKLPSWAAVDGIIYPPHLNMEQCSSELTARYKADIVNSKSINGTFLDLTGGFGVDFYWMAKDANEPPVYVEQDETLCAIAEHNFRLLGLSCSVCCGTAAAILASIRHAAVVFLDPARRNEHGGRTYGIADCTPNVLELMPLLTEKVDRVVLKLSPMLDWRKAVSDLQYPMSHVITVHIVSVDNECKELLIEMRNEIATPHSDHRSEKLEMRNTNEEMKNGIRIVCVNLFSNGGRQEFTFWGQAPNTSGYTSGDGFISHSSFPISHSSFLISHFLYAPNASIMKAGCFAELEHAYPVQQVAPNSHLFISDKILPDFPGRCFQIQAISSMNKQELKEKLTEKINQKLTPLKSANIAVRNFPLTAEQLRKKLKLKDGGDTYIFATTLADGQHRLFVCRKPES